ncbi:MAG: hypothetical protein ACE5FA_03235 [Dehalococcoidia bacterium]
MANNKTVLRLKDEPDQLAADWQERAREAVRRFRIPSPSDEEAVSADEAEQRLKDYEQEGGE